MPIASLCPWWHYATLLETAVKVTTWGIYAKKKKKNLEEPTLYFVTQTLFWLAQNF